MRYSPFEPPRQVSAAHSALWPVCALWLCVAVLFVGPRVSAQQVSAGGDEKSVDVGREPSGAAGLPIELDLFNGVYENLDGGLEPIRQGPLTIRLASPEHRLEVFSNRLYLSPGTEGRIAVVADIEFGGGGRLTADIEGAGMTQRIDDYVEAPRQVVRARGEVDVESHEGSYVLTIAAHDGLARVHVESGFAQQIQSLCGAMALMPMFSLDCAPLARALTHVGVPLPPVGTRMVLPKSWLSPAEQQAVDALLLP